MNPKIKLIPKPILAPNKLDEAPIITPPAKDPYIISLMSIFWPLLSNMLKIKAEMQLAHKASLVFR